jgi:acyl dehydratase
MLDTSYIGKTLPAIRYQVDRSKIRELARALGDTNPLFHDVDAARAAGYRDLVAPVTFPTLFRFWGGTETRGILEAMGGNIMRLLHGEEEYEYFDVLQAGDDITGQLEIVGIETKEGRSGIMDFVKTQATYRNQDGNVVVIARATMVLRR